VNHRSSLWFDLSIALLISMLLACIAALAVFTALAPSLTLFNPLSSASPPEVPPTLQPTPHIKCPNGDCASACLTKLASVLRVDPIPESAPKSAIQHPEGTQAISLVTYRVNGDQLGAPQFSPNIPSNLLKLQQDTDPQQLVWNYFAAIIPANYRREIVAYIVSTDGQHNMLASVEQSSNQPISWALNVDVADAADPRDLTFTLLHEFGHLLTLNDSQVTPDPTFLANPDDLQIYQQEAAACPQFFASGGCSRPDSYINQFFDQFWPKLYKEWSKANAAKDKANYASLLAKFYGSHSTQFITPYAATSPEEDIAEGWAYFVLTPKPANDSIAHRKVLFFYNFPELVGLRQQIIYGICNYASSQ
jgi:hypothetical protein